MIHKDTKLLALFLGVFICSHHVWADEQNSIGRSRQEQISQLYLQKFPSKVQTAQDTLTTMQKYQQELLAYNFKIQEVKKIDANIEKIAHGIVTNQINKEENFIIPITMLRKLAAFDTKENDQSLTNVLNDSFSPLAKSAFLYELTNPTNYVDLLLEKQQFIKRLCIDETLHQLLQKTGNLESSILNLWTHEQLLPKYVEEGTYFGGQIPQFLRIDWLFKSLNKFPMMLELKAPGPCTMLSSAYTFFGILVGPELVNKYGSKEITEDPSFRPALQTYLSASYATRAKLLMTESVAMTKAMGEGALYLGHAAFTKKPEYAAFAAIYAGLVIYPILMQTYNCESQFAHLQAYFIDLASYITQVRQLTKYFKEHNLSFPLAFPELQHLIDLDNKTKHSADFNQLVDLLKTGTFKGNASKLSYLGRVKCAYKLFMNVRQEFEPVLYAMAKLQMYDGVAQLMQESATKENTFCFAEFVDYGPYVEAVDFWNPMVGQEKAVSNSLIMTPNQKDIILHGPNTGGKTTTIKGLIYNILLAQTLGIASARQFIVSPFAQINCFMDIQDDVSAGSSLFDAEVRFATELHNNVQSLKQGEYAFTIADEILRSTSPSKGQACAYQFTKKLAKNPRSMSITVTHYPKLVELATEVSNNGFRTFHVEIKREDGKVIRTFKLKEGLTTENIAGDILQEHGIFDADDLLEVERLEEEFLH